MEPGVEEFLKGFEYESSEPADYAAAVGCYQISLQHGNGWAQYRLGICFEFGKGVRQDIKEAERLYKAAALQGNMFAQNCLAILYQDDGKYKKAKHWFEKAVVQGHESAKANLLALDKHALLLQYYSDTAILNLLRTSRTAQFGEIDISASAGTELKISKDSIGGYSREKLNKLRSENEKARGLDLENLKTLSPSQIKALVRKNYLEAIGHIFRFAKEIQANDVNDLSARLAGFVESIARLVGRGIVPDANWFRTHKSSKYPYTNEGNLWTQFKAFCDEFADKLRNIPEGANRIQWAMRTAAWVEYRINLTDHFMTDSCGKVASLMSILVCVVGDCRLPTFSDKRDYLTDTPTRPRDVNADDFKDKKFLKWAAHYERKFPSTLHCLDLELPANTDAKNYYEQNSLDNLRIISNTAKTGIRGITAYVGKQSHINKLPQIQVKPLTIARFSSLIEYLYRNRHSGTDSVSLDKLLRQIAKSVNEKSVTDDFRTTENLWWTKVKMLKQAYENFFKEVVERLEDEKYDFIETIALIHYRLFLQHHFFKDGNNRIAVAFVTFVCMKKQKRLPKFTEFNNMTKYYNKQKVTSDSLFYDPQFHLWASFYRSLFPESTSLIPPKIDEKENFEDGWDVTIEKTLDKSHTIYAKGLVFRSFEALQEMREATGIEVKKLVLFRPARMVLHEGLIYMKTRFKVNLEILQTHIGLLRQHPKTIARVQALEREFDEDRGDFEKYISYVLEDFFRSVNVDSDLQKRIETYSSCIQLRIERGKCNVRFFESKQLMVNLLVDDLLRDLYKEKVHSVVKGYFTELEQKTDLQRLKVANNFNRSAWAIVGGPASGKSTIQKAMLIGDDCCIVNPDDMKPLLETETVHVKNGNYAALVHEESSYISDALLKRLDVMVKNDQAPNIFLDIVTSSIPKMNVISYGGATVHLSVVSCDVEDKGGAISRSFQRAENNDEKNRDRGRYVPTRVILEGHAGQSLVLPETIEKFKLSLNLYDTNEKLPRLTAVIDEFGKHMKVYEPRLFCRFMRKARLNTKAAFPEQLYLDVENGAFIAELFLSYLEKGITISLLYGQGLGNPKLGDLEQKIQHGGKSQDEIDSLRNQIKQSQKQNIFAVFSFKKGIMCKDFRTFCDMFSSPEEAQNFLLYFLYPNPQETRFPKLSVHLYDCNNYACILKRAPQSFSRVCMVSIMPDARDVQTVYLVRSDVNQEIIAHFYNGSWCNSSRSISEVQSLGKTTWDHPSEIDQLVSHYGCTKEEIQFDKNGILETLCPVVYKRVSPVRTEFLYQIRSTCLKKKNINVLRTPEVPCRGLRTLQEGPQKDQ